uniref:Uncharacterized protein n=1 Tax=Scophthalmus maximus TaxID=52904 RepID=A0A8D3EDJ3_SCOMX
MKRVTCYWHIFKIAGTLSQHSSVPIFTSVSMFEVGYIRSCCILISDFIIRISGLMSLRLCIEKTSIHTQQPFISTAKFDLKLDTPELQRAESDSREREGGIQGGLVAKWWDNIGQLIGSVV